MTNINTYDSMISQLDSIDLSWREKVKYIITKPVQGINGTRIYNVRDNHDSLIRTITDRTNFQIEKIENDTLICREANVQ